MTQMQAIKLSTRLISAYFIYRASFALVAAIRYAVLISTGVFRILDGLKPGRWELYTYSDAALTIVEFAMCVTFAVVLYRGGPRLVRFLTGHIDSETSDPPSEPIPIVTVPESAS